MPRIDVVIPCYNAGRYLSQCVRSVPSQGIDSLRIVIIDNASTDGSAEAARRLAADDGRVEVVWHARNLGPHASFNEGVDLARGDYFMILCADDLLTEGSLRRATEALECNSDAVFALGSDLKMVEGEEFAEPGQADGWRVTEGTRFIGDCCRHSGFSLALGAILVRTSAQKKAGHYRACLPYTDDLEMALRLARLGSVVEFEGALGIRREHPAQQSVVSFSGERTQIKERMAAFDSFFGLDGRDVPQAVRLHAIARRRIAEVAIRSAARRFLEGDPGSAAAMFTYAMLYRIFDALPLLLLGHLVSPHAAALFSRTLMIGQIPDKLVLGGAMTVVLPAFSAEIRQGRELKGPYLAALSIVTVLHWPALLLLSVLAYPVVEILLGNQWSEAAPLLQVVAIALLFSFSFELNYPVLVAMGAIRDLFIRALIVFPLSGLLLATAVIFGGLHAAAWCMLVTVPFQAYVALSFVRRRLGLKRTDIAAALWKSAVVAIASAAAPLSAIVVSGSGFALSFGQASGAGLLGFGAWTAAVIVTRHPLLEEIKRTFPAFQRNRLLPAE